MNVTIMSLLGPAVFTAIGVLLRHMWPTNPATPTTPTTPTTDPFNGLPGLPGHPILNSPIIKEILQELETQFLNSIKAQVSNTIVNPPPAAPKA